MHAHKSFFRSTALIVSLQLLQCRAGLENLHNIPEEPHRNPITYPLTSTPEILALPSTSTSTRSLPTRPIISLHGDWKPCSLFVGCMKFKFVICKDEYFQRLGTRQRGQSITHLSHSIVLQECRLAHSFAHKQP